MKVLSGLSAIGLAAALLAGCAGVEASKFDKQKLPADNTFAAQLALGYQSMSKSAAGEGNYTLADSYAGLGKAAAAGNPPAPPDTAAYPVPADKASELTAARARLVKALDANARTTFPADAARCQIFYHSWLEEQSQNASFQQDQIANSKAAFNACIVRLEKEEKMAKPVAAPASFQVFFDFDKYNLRPDATNTLKQFVDFAKKEKLAKIRVIGHTDTVGSKAYNLALSKRRAETVKSFLVANGIPAAGITTEGVGFADLLVPTPPGVPELKNRRAQILFQKPGS
jgi:outer membrane protein OmpA-like peptidoglycan-associated protein